MSHLTNHVSIKLAAKFIVSNATASAVSLILISFNIELIVDRTD